MSLLRPSSSNDRRMSRQLGVPRPRQPLHGWSEAAEDDDMTRRAPSDNVTGQNTFGAGKAPPSKFDSYLSDDGSQESERTDMVREITPTGRRKYLSRHVATELESVPVAPPEWGAVRPTWSTLGRRLSMSAGNRFARAPAEVPSTARATGASLSVHRPHFDEAPKTRRMSWIGTIKRKLAGRRHRRGDQDTAPITRDSFEDLPKSDDREGELLPSGVDVPERPVYPRLRSQPSLNRLARRTSGRRDVLSGTHIADVIFVPEEDNAHQEHRGVSPHANGARRRSQFILPHRRSFASDDRSTYTKLDENAY